MSLVALSALDPLLSRVDGPVLLSALVGALALVGAMGAMTLLLPAVYGCVLRPQDLKKKYGAEWAIVTGGSSGIGKAIVERLCAQGINVIILAVPDKLLDETTREVRSRFPDVRVEPVGADLSKPGFMKQLDAVTHDKDVQLLFCNAGFMLSGFFHSTPMGANKANAAVNVGCHLELTHEYVNRMLAAGKRGAVCFTSSPAWMLPSPTAAMYAGTKAFVSHFGASMAAEVKSLGIDVCVVHPSPIRSRFYDNAGDGAEVNFFKSTASGPEVLVSHLFACVGRLVFANQGYFPKVMGVLHHLMDFTSLVEITANVAHTAGSFQLAKEKDEAKYQELLAKAVEIEKSKSGKKKKKTPAKKKTQAIKTRTPRSKSRRRRE
jgi:short-subunit dehydrogenase